MPRESSERLGRRFYQGRAFRAHHNALFDPTSMAYAAVLSQQMEILAIALMVSGFNGLCGRAVATADGRAESPPAPRCFNGLCGRGVATAVVILSSNSNRCNDCAPTRQCKSLIWL